MNDENLHITPDPQKGFPKPDIPADEAWKNMAAMLDAEMPGSPPDAAPPQKPPSSGGSGILGKSIQFWSAGLIILSMAGLATWGVLHYSHRPKTSVIKNDTIHVLRQNAVDDSTGTGKQQNIKNLSRQPSNRDIAVRHKEISEPVNMAKNEQPPALTPSSVSLPPASETKNIAPSRTDYGTTNPTVNINTRQTPVILENPKDSVKPVEVRSVTPSPYTDSVISSGKPVSMVNPAIVTPPEIKPDKTQSTEGFEKSKKSPRRSENLSWQMGVSANVGEVVQKGRNPNLFYGGTVSGGLWHKKLKASIETGIGWTVYNDYGSVSTNVRITDSIPGDTVHPVTHNDTTRVSASRYRYQYLQIPLFISKRIIGSNTFEFGITTGPVVGLLISQIQVSSSTSGPDNGEILSTANKDYTRLKTTWQWKLMLDLIWNINDRLSFNLSPSGIYYINNLYDRDNRPPDIPFGIGLNAGLIYKFK